ncbi:hypothetical protein SPICUR_09135 [Spiribacter curvatus]|uniref:Uncharacterized protein n=1 Tax=Spiribacter curvatus TaxID=1335757 RepID=U5T8K3_9GAMM|nr:hypothetical protein SPICUR_09135 [Spiribacter curvatus]
MRWVTDVARGAARGGALGFVGDGGQCLTAER